MEKKACLEKVYAVTASDLPLSCPMAGMAVWDAHPKIYLPIEKSGKECCPYCGAVYVLEGMDCE